MKYIVFESENFRLEKDEEEDYFIRIKFEDTDSYELLCREKRDGDITVTKDELIELRSLIDELLKDEENV